MRANYTMKNGDIVKIFLYNDMLDSQNAFLRTNATYQINNEKKEKHLDIFFDEKLKKKYFQLKGERKYFDDFDYIPYEELVSQIKSGNINAWLEYDKILATFLREPEKICVLLDTDIPDTILPNFGISMCGNNRIRTIMVPYLEGRYKMSDWHYKISFTSVFEPLRNISTYSTYYFPDFSSLIRDGHIELVNKEDIMKELEEYQQRYLKQITKEKKNPILGIVGTIKRKMKKYNFEEKIISVPAISVSNTEVHIKRNYELLLNCSGIYFPVSMKK